MVKPNPRAYGGSIATTPQLHRPVASDQLPDLVKDDQGKSYRVIKPPSPDPDGWVQLIPISAV